jgi:hypothetical protein
MDTERYRLEIGLGIVSVGGPPLLDRLGVSVPWLVYALTVALGLAMIAHAAVAYAKLYRAKRIAGRLGRELGALDYARISASQIRRIDKLVGTIDAILERMAPTIYSELRELRSLGSSGSLKARQRKARTIGRRLAARSRALGAHALALANMTADYRKGVFTIADSQGVVGVPAFSDQDKEEAVQLEQTTAKRLLFFSVIMSEVQPATGYPLLQGDYGEGLRRFLQCLETVQTSVQNIHDAAARVGRAST